MSDNTEETGTPEVPTYRPIDRSLVDALDKMMIEEQEDLIRAAIAVTLRGDAVDQVDLGDLLDEAPPEVASTMRRAMSVVALLSVVGKLPELTDLSVYGLLREQTTLLKLSALLSVVDSHDLSEVRKELAEQGVEGFSDD